MYSMKRIENEIHLTLNDSEGEMDYVLKLDEYNDLVIACHGIVDKITRYNHIYEILDDKEYIVKTLDKYNTKDDFSNIFKDLFYGFHYKGGKNHKVNVKTDGYITTFKTSFGNITFQNDIHTFENPGLGILIDDYIIGNVIDIEPLSTLGEFDIFKVKRMIEIYINETEINTHHSGNNLVGCCRELVKMVMRLFPNYEPN
jgi:hypothetical protein